MTYGFWYPRLFCWWRPYCLSSDLYSTLTFTVRRVSFFDSQYIAYENIAKSQHRFYGKTLKHPGAEPRFYGKTFKFWRNISVRNDCIFNCFKGRLPQKPQICANLLALGGVQTVKCHPPVWRRHCQLVMTGRWLRSSSDWCVNRTILVRFSKDSAGDVWRHNSLQQQ